MEQPRDLRAVRQFVLTAGPLDPWQAARLIAGLTAVIVILAVLAGGGWLAVRELTAPHHPSGAAVAAQTLTPLSATAFGPPGAATATTLNSRGSLSTAAPRRRGTPSGTPPPPSGT